MGEREGKRDGWRERAIERMKHNVMKTEILTEHEQEEEWWRGG